MIETITFNGKEYPHLQSIGGASRWIMPIAEQFITDKMMVADIGFCKDEWRFKNAYGVDPSAIPEHGDAMNFIGNDWDALFSSHCLEHVKENWYNVLDYWLTKIKTGGIIFLYLPHKSQEYWLPENNRKHVHSFDGSEIETYLKSLGHKVIRSGVDLNNSFVVVCEKVELQVKVEGKLSLEQIGIEPQYKPHADLLNKFNFEKKIERVASKKHRLDKTDDCYPTYIAGAPKPIINLGKEHGLKSGIEVKALTNGKINCLVCNTGFILGDSRYSDRGFSNEIGDMTVCPNCNKQYTYIGNFIWKLPNIFNSSPL